MVRRHLFSSELLNTIYPLIQTVILFKPRARSMVLCSRSWHWLGQQYRHMVVHANARAHTASPSPGSPVDKWVEGPEVLLCHTRVILYSCQVLQHDKKSYTHTNNTGLLVTLQDLTYLLSTKCFLWRQFSALPLHTCVTDKLEGIYVCGACPSPSFPRFISIYDQHKKNFFFKGRQDQS